MRDALLFFLRSSNQPFIDLQIAQDLILQLPGGTVIRRIKSSLRIGALTLQDLRLRGGIDYIIIEKVDTRPRIHPEIL